jgi:hypothetical protein
MHAEVDLILPLPGLSSVCGKPVVARCDGFGWRYCAAGGGGASVVNRRAAGAMHRDPHAPDQIRHEVAETIRFRALAIHGWLSRCQ